MFDSLIKSVENSFIEFNLRRLIYLIFILAIGVGGLYGFNEVTGYGYFAKYEKKLNALQKLQEIEKAGLSASLKPIHEDLVKQLGDVDSSSAIGVPINRPSSTASLVDIAVKAVSASFVFWFLGIMGIAQKSQGSNQWQSLVVGGFVFAIAASLVAIIIPTFYSVWVNAVINVAVQILLIFAMINQSKKTSSANSTV